jgi:hypothetical protein
MAQTQATMDRLVEVAHSLLHSISAFKLGAQNQVQGHILPPPAALESDIATQPMAVAKGAVDHPNLRRTKKRHSGTGIEADSVSVAKGSITNTLPLKDVPLHPATWRHVESEHSSVYEEQGPVTPGQAGGTQASEASPTKDEQAEDEPVTQAESEHWQ